MSTGGLDLPLEPGGAHTAPGVDPASGTHPGTGVDPAAGSAASTQSVRVHVFVDGRVQGVWFRQSTYREACRLGVNGWVRNLPDGRVEAIYEGPPGAVEELLAWTRRGPDRAFVTSLQIHDEAPKGERGFSVR